MNKSLTLGFEYKGHIPYIMNLTKETMGIRVKITKHDLPKGTKVLVDRVVVNTHCLECQTLLDGIALEDKGFSEALDYIRAILPLVG